MTLTSFLTDNGFVQVARVILEQGEPVIRFLSPRPVADVPATYLWLAFRAQGEIEPLYVGGTSKGVYTRHRTGHQPSWSGTGTGGENARLIREHYAAFPDAEIRVYARESGELTVFGQAVRATWLEESALIQKLEPRFNRAHVKRRPRTEVIAAAMARPDAAPDVPGFEFDARDLLNGDTVTDFLQSLEPARQALFGEIVEYLAAFDPMHRQKVVGMFNGQPAGYSGKPMLVFAHRLTRKELANDWYGRLPLVDTSSAPLTAIFHRGILRPDVQAALVDVGTSGEWRPADIRHLMAHPGEYLREAPAVRAG
ncbi:MAG: hypothetical protein RL722_260 [Pseudomonadota bacterium]|jgi:hypothetical protein